MQNNGNIILNYFYTELKEKWKKKTVWKYHSVNVRDTILINSELFTLSKRNDGAVLAPVNDFTKNSRQSSNLSLIAAIYQDQILKGKKEQEIPQKVHNTIFDFNAEIYERQLLKLNKDKYLSLIGKKLLKILREMTLENAFGIKLYKYKEAILPHLLEVAELDYSVHTILLGEFLMKSGHTKNQQRNPLHSHQTVTVVMAHTS